MDIHFASDFVAILRKFAEGAKIGWENNCEREGCDIRRDRSLQFVAWEQYHVVWNRREKAKTPRLL
jgi:hypothetical protein